MGRNTYVLAPSPSYIPQPPGFAALYTSQIWFYISTTFAQSANVVEM